MPVSTKKYEEQGLVRMEIDMDFQTYAILLALVEKSGYRLGKKSRQKSEGIRGVLAQGILELYQKYIENDMSDEKEHQDHGLDKINQQAYIFGNYAWVMKINGIPIEDIVSTLQQKLPAYLKNHEKGKFLAKKTMSKFLAASTFSGVDYPELTKGMRNELKIRKYLNYLRSRLKRADFRVDFIGY